MAAEQQIPVLAARVVEFQEELEKMPEDDVQWAIQNTKEALALWVEAVRNRVKNAAQTVVRIMSGVLSTTIIPATTDKFVAKDKFKVDTGRKAKVKISWLGDNFRAHFLGKTEDSFPGSTIARRKLEKDSVDGPILLDLGGKEKAKTTLAELYAMLVKQPNGEDGDLLTNGCANIFYIEDVDGTLWAVVTRWDGDGWSVAADSVELPVGWLAGRQVFSRNSLAA